LFYKVNESGVKKLKNFFKFYNFFDIWCQRFNKFNMKIYSKASRNNLVTI
jgi:hypothetical protein